MKETTTIIKPRIYETRTIEERIKEHMKDVKNVGYREAANLRKIEGTLVIYQEEEI